MSGSTRMKAATLLTALLLCILLTQTAFATENVTIDNTSVENVTYVNIPTENSTIDIIQTANAISNQIDPSSDFRSIMAGNGDSFSVSFTNKGNETLTLIPKLVTTSNSGNNINESWITISPTNATVAPGAVQKFNIKENVPSDAEGGDYQGIIAFTDDLVPNSTSYVNSMNLDISVQAQPKIELQATSLSDNLEAGKEYDYQIKIKNVASKDITIDPKLNNYNYGYGQAFDNDAIEISAPSTIKASEVTNMTIRVHVPENVTGSYNSYINMNVNGSENDGSSPQIGLYFTVWQSPVVPYVKAFRTTTDSPITIEVSTYKYSSDMGLRISPKDKDPSIFLGLKHNSIPVNLTFVKSVESSSINIGGNSLSVEPIDDKSIYQNSGSTYVETYKAPGEIGDWELSILPKNTVNFGYSITVGGSNPIIKRNVTIEKTTKVSVPPHIHSGPVVKKPIIKRKANK